MGGAKLRFPPLVFFSSSKSQWRGLGRRRISLRSKHRSLGVREKRLRESTKCCHWRGPRQLNQGDTDFSLSETIAPARTAWDFMKCFWTRIPDRSSLHNLCFVSTGNWQPTERHSQKQCAQLLAFFLKKKSPISGPSIKQTSLSLPFRLLPSSTEAWFSSQINKRNLLSFFCASHSLLVGVNNAPSQHCHSAWNVFACLFTWKSCGDGIRERLLIYQCRKTLGWFWSYLVWQKSFGERSCLLSFIITIIF